MSCFNREVDNLYRTTFFREFKTSLDLSTYLGKFILLCLTMTFLCNSASLALLVAFPSFLAFSAMIVLICCFSYCNSAFFTLPIKSHSSFALYALCILFSLVPTTLLAISSISVFCVKSCIKISYWLNFFAFRALLCYDLLRHALFLTKRMCFEPLQGRSLCGSFYYT